MNYRFPSILIKGKREIEREKYEKEGKVNSGKKTCIILLFSVNELHSFLPCVSTQPKVEREDEQTLLIQLCYISYKLLLNYKHTT